MAGGSFEKSVKGATKIKLAAPKSKYIEHILISTHSGEAGVAEIFRTLQNRLRDSTWTIVFKSLIVIHLMIREGSLDVTLRYLAEYPRKIAISSFSEVQSQGSNIRRYSEYLIARSKAFADTQVDYVRSGTGRLKRLTVEKGLLRETECVQKQIRALLKCADLLTDEPENEITLTAFRLLTLDVLTLYSVMNEGTINVLEHYFEMSRPDSERALRIYKTFSTQTESVVKFLGVARHFESATRLEIPNLKHASTDLAQLLEDDLNDPDFDQRRREYLAQKGIKKPPRFETNKSDNKSERPTTSSNNTAPARDMAPPPKAAPPVDLIDFFDSIEQNQQQLATQAPQQAPQQFPPQMPQQIPQQDFGFQQFQQQPFQQAAFQPQQADFTQQPQQTGFQQQQQQQPGFGQQANVYGGVQQQQQQQQQQQSSNPFAANQAPQPLQPNHTGAGFGGYTPQPQSYNFQTTLSSIPQEGIPSFQQPMQTGNQSQATNPFRQSMLPQNTGAFPQNTTTLARQPTNPFAKHLSVQPQPPPQPPQQPPQQAQHLTPQRTGTNPFARASSVPPQNSGLAAAPLRPSPTGSTNPFRQSAFVNQQTGQGWQASGQQGTMGGFENLETVPVFPRPGQLA